MSRNGGYGQFCPVAKAAEVLTTRWTPLVLRELIAGSRHFNEIHRGVPLMSRALLSQRLKDLEKVGVIRRAGQRGSQSVEYRLTSSGEELRPIIEAMGEWGRKWVESAIEDNDWDAGVLMWDMRRRIDVSALPAGEAVLRFEYTDAPVETRLWWVLADSSGVDLCQSDPGRDIDLYVTTTVPVLARVWIGNDRLSRAIAADEIELIGDESLRASIGRWLKLSALTEGVTPSPVA
ncbi:MAG: transcriptional regulator [Alphaproteobacteria bacterium]|nr:transcriptional regulator [Alphaproteobacteria bacterium]